MKKLAIYFWYKGFVEELEIYSHVFFIVEITVPILDAASTILKFKNKQQWKK